MSIKSPRIDQSHRDYKSECEAALELGLRDLTDAAIVAGWAPQAIFAALQILILKQQIAYSQDSDPADDPKG